MFDRKWTETMYRAHTWDELTISVKKSVARFILAGPRPSACRCGSHDVCVYSRSGKYLDDPADYYYECRKCHRGPKPIKYPGRPKGSKNKKSLAKEKMMSPWDRMCASAEKELYGSGTGPENNI